MIAKIIDVEIRPGHTESFRRAQDIWNRESRRSSGYLGEHMATISDQRVIIISFWASRSIYDRWMATEHDRIAALAGSDAHYDSLTITVIDGETPIPSG